MNRLLPEDHPRLRTRLATYAVALVAIPLGFAWGYCSKDWPIRHRLWALWLATPFVWGWTWLRYPLGLLITISVSIALGIGLLYGAIRLGKAVTRPAPNVSAPAVPSPQYRPLDDTAQALVARGLLTEAGEMAPLLRELLREKASEGWSAEQMTHLLAQRWGIATATELVTRWSAADTVLTPEGKRVLAPAPTTPAALMPSHSPATQEPRQMSPEERRVQAMLDATKPILEILGGVLLCIFVIRLFHSGM